MEQLKWGRWRENSLAYYGGIFGEVVDVVGARGCGLGGCALP